ncbi:hypothetical protein H9P43_002023 [Blastocladiella emersonii ATCC 22665]|nr:hypothetical protein H9P43_002023 [Blastocladiella emersonii ATCC 22665]
MDLTAALAPFMQQVMQPYLQLQATLQAALLQQQQQQTNAVQQQAALLQQQQQSNAAAQQQQQQAAVFQQLAQAQAQQQQLSAAAGIQQFLAPATAVAVPAAMLQPGSMLASSFMQAQPTPERPVADRVGSSGGSRSLALQRELLGIGSSPEPGEV